MKSRPQSRHPPIRCLLLLSTILALPGCARLDPELRTANWRPTGVNDANLAVMVANRGDLMHGRGQADADGQEAVAAVLRLRAGKVKPLPDSGLAELQLQSNGTSGASGGN